MSIPKVSFCHRNALFVGTKHLHWAYKDFKAIEEVITINELRSWLNVLDSHSIDNLLNDINKYYRLELNLPFTEIDSE